MITAAGAQLSQAMRPARPRIEQFSGTENLQGSFIACAGHLRGESVDATEQLRMQPDPVCSQTPYIHRRFASGAGCSRLV